MTEPDGTGPLVEAGRLLEAGDLDGAIRACQRALRVTPDSFPAHLKLAQIYGRKSRQGRDPVLRGLVDREFAEAMRLAPDTETAHEALLETALETGRTAALASRYRGEWASLPFAASAARRAEQAAAPMASAPDPGSDTLRKWGKLAAVLIVAGIAWQVLPPYIKRWSAAMSPAGPTAKDFSLVDLSGRTVTLSDFRDKAVVVVDFWATWCGPCRASLPALHDLRAKYRGKGVEVLNLSLDDDTSVVKPYIDREGLDLWVLLDRGHATARAWGVRGIPSIFVVDKKGAIRENFVGYSPELEAKIEKLVDSLR